MRGRTLANTRRLAALAVALVLVAVVAGCGQTAAPGPSSSSAPSTEPTLTVADVKAVLTSMDETGNINAVYRVDVPAFAESVVSQLPIYVDSTDPSATPTTFRTPDSAVTTLTPDQASATVSEAVGVFRRIERASGTQAAMAAMTLGSMGEGGDKLSPRDQSVLALLQEGAGTLSLLFGQPDPKSWTWKVTDIAIVGTDTADVTYQVSVPKGRGWEFTASAHTKLLRFERAPDGGWMLSGWPGYPHFEAELRGSIKPQDIIPNLVPNWWDSIGME